MNRIRSVVMAVIATAAVGGTMARAEEVDQPGSDKAAQATQLARQTLAQQLKVADDTLAVAAVEPRTWNDSSLGCGKPGAAALQVITEGYIVRLVSQGRTYPVHVAGNTVVVCDRMQAAGEARRSARAQGIDQAVILSRSDLASRLSADAKEIRLVNVRPQRWPDSALGCPRPDESIVSGEVSGFRVDLSLQGRVYTYHATGTEARACPAIEAE